MSELKKNALDIFVSNIILLLNTYTSKFNTEREKNNIIFKSSRKTLKKENNIVVLEESPSLKYIPFLFFLWFDWKLRFLRYNISTFSVLMVYSMILLVKNLYYENSWMGVWDFFFIIGRFKIFHYNQFDRNTIESPANNW